MDAPVVMKVLGLVDGQRTEWDGTYVAEYDPERDGRDRKGRVTLMHLRTTRDPREAKHYASSAEAMEDWRRVCERDPVRPWDGKPNRPLTAFNVTLKSLAMALADEAGGRG